MQRSGHWDGGFEYRLVKRMPAWKSLTKNQGKAHIYQDVLVLGPIYATTSLVLVEHIYFLSNAVGIYFNGGRLSL